MANVMVAVMPFHGHVAPLEAVVRAFIAQGHTVRVYTGSAYASRFTAAGARIVAWQAAQDFDENHLDLSFPALRGRKGPRQMLANVEHLFIGTGAGQCSDLVAAYEEEPWDVIVADGLSMGAHLASERMETPWVTVGIVPLAIPSRDLPPPMLALPPARGRIGRLRDRLLWALLRVTTGGMQRAYVRQRTAVGLPDDGRRFEDAWHSPELFCSSGVPELEYPRTDLPDAVRFVGALTSPADAEHGSPTWWRDVETADVPVLHVTQGTLNVDPHDLIEPAMSALGRQDVLVAVSTGRRGETTLPFPVPPNARVADFLPYGRLVPRLSVMITNGGWGGVLIALSHGVPLIVAGGDIDKPEIAARVAWAGAGIDLRTGTPKPRAILEAWQRIQEDPSFTASARRIGESLRSHDGPAEVVAHTLALLGQSRPAR